MVAVSTYLLNKAEINTYYPHLKNQMGGYLHSGVEILTGLVEITTIEEVMSQ